MLRGNKPAPGSQWGPWTYIVVPSTLGDILMLSYKDRPSIAIRLEGGTTSAEVRDSIMQLKTHCLIISTHRSASLVM